jgi:hypothetical protein
LLSGKLFSQSFDFPDFINSEEKITETNSVRSENDSILNNNNTKDTLANKFNPADYEIEAVNIDSNEIVIDGDLSEPIWKNLKRYGGFKEVDPGDNTEPKVNTEFQICYNKEYLYFGFTCYETDMTKVRSSVTDRDAMFPDDWVLIMLDPYADGKSAYELAVNPHGIQGDLQRLDNGNEDESLDIIWESEAKIYKDKWTVEIGIPFKSIRFPHNADKDWWLHVLRNRPRESSREQISFVPISRDDPSMFTRCSKIKGIRNVKAGKNLEVMPYFSSSQYGYKSDFGNANSDFLKEDIKGKFGFNLRYGITSNLTADFTYNPDFSQVESDAGQINVNSTTALFFNEKRPFFLEGKEIFSTPFDLFYTRSINKPLIALKTTGRIGSTDIGYVFAYDENTPFIIPYGEGTDFLPTERKSYSNVLRIKTNFKNESYLGLIYTDRQVRKDDKQVSGGKAGLLDIDGYNRVFGFDGKFLFLKNYYLIFQLINLQTKELNDPSLYTSPVKFDNDKYTGTFDGEKFSGFASYVSFSRSARHWNFDITYDDASPNVRRDLGFNNTNDFRLISTSQSYTFYPDGKILQRMTPSVYAHLRYNYDGHFKEVFSQVQMSFNFIGQIYANAGYFLFNNEEFRGVYNKNANRFFINFQSQTLQSIRGGFNINFGKYIVRDEIPYVGYGYSVYVWNDIKPFDRLIFSNEYNYFELSKSYGGEKLYAGYIFRNKTTYQFSKNAFLRIVFQYDSFMKEFYIDPLFSYKLNPFTIFYIGSSHNFTEMPETTGVSKYAESQRQIFMKIQYLWRM